MLERIFYLFCYKIKKDALEVEDFCLKFGMFFKYDMFEIFKLIFEIYDFDNNGLIMAEDVILIWNNLLSYETSDK